jgi:hypothetical protein
MTRLADGTGYRRISGFLTPVLDSVLKSINDLRDAPALIIDLRGNPGGQFPVRKAIASQLVGEPKLLMRYQHRDGSLKDAYLDPVSDPYKGEVVILVDEQSASSSEEFAGSLQALGRATIVGSQTPGRVLVMDIAPLPKGALLIYPYLQSQTPEGRVLEDDGVVPDIAVALDRQQVLAGVDVQLKAAIDYLAGRTGQSSTAPRSPPRWSVPSRATSSPSPGIVAAYHLDLVRVAFVVCGNDGLAEDAAQAAWWIAWRKLSSLRDPDRLKPWLVAVAANEARKLLRHEHRHGVVELMTRDGLTASSARAAGTGAPSPSPIAAFGSAPIERVATRSR